MRKLKRFLIAISVILSFIILAIRVYDESGIVTAIAINGLTITSILQLDLQGRMTNEIKDITKYIYTGRN